MCVCVCVCVGMGVSKGEGGGGGIFLSLIFDGECGREVGGVLVGVYECVGVGMGMRVLVVPGTSVGQLVPFGGVNVAPGIRGMAAGGWVCVCSWYQGPVSDSWSHSVVLTLLPVLGVWQQVGASGFWWFGLPTLPPGPRRLWISLGQDRRGCQRSCSICDRCVHARVAT
jgi:hypothetical protein